MDEILRSLRAGSRVLDLGCAAGSFRATATAADVVRVDLDPLLQRGIPSGFVQADAARLPFVDRTFAAVISNHSLEHFTDHTAALREIGRVIASNGALFVAVPDASTLTDRLYRWLARGGGHVNAFTDDRKTAAAIEQATGLRHVGTRLLCSSLSFLNRRNSPRPLPRRLWLLGAGHEWSLFFYVWLSRRLDKWLNTRTSVYGWGFYFGTIDPPIETGVWVNVCIRCGSGSSSVSLLAEARVSSRSLGIRTWRCPNCDASNPFANDPSGPSA